MSRHVAPVLAFDAHRPPSDFRQIVTKWRQLRLAHPIAFEAIAYAVQFWAGDASATSPPRTVLQTLQIDLPAWLRCECCKRTMKQRAKRPRRATRKGATR